MSIADIAKSIAQAKKVAVITGAGISAESGVPTFRDPNGYWEQYKPEDLANEAAFLRDPELVSNWYHYRRQKVLSVSPNSGHLALVELESLVPEFLLVTQNVDRLHQRAGQKNVVEVHGTIVASHCNDCGQAATETQMKITEGTIACEACNGLLRPSVVWFGESLPQAALEKAFQFASECDVCLVVGTSGVVYPAAQIPIEAKQSGAELFEFNIQESALSSIMNESVFSPSGESLPQLISLLKN